jgi:hypothetical protein
MVQRTFVAFRLALAHIGKPAHPRPVAPAGGLPDWDDQLESLPDWDTAGLGR